MNIFVVHVKSYLPYPIEKEYTEKATSFGAAVSRAIKKYRKDQKGKHVEALSIRVGKAGLSLPKK